MLSVSYRVIGCLAAASILLFLNIWINSGTLAPYAVTLRNPLSDECGYLFNRDHYHFVAVYNLLDGADHHAYRSSVVLRRILYYALAYPLMKLKGFYIGGLLANAIIYSTALIAFGVLIFRRHGTLSAGVFCLLFSTFPAVSYWGALPYSYVLILPIALFLLVVFQSWRVEQITLLRSFFIGLLMGVANLGYDLFIVIAPAVLLWMLQKKRYVYSLPFFIGLMAPVIAWIAVLKKVYLVDAANSNSKIFTALIRSYYPPYEIATWLPHLREAPLILVSNYLNSAYIALPICFLLYALLGMSKRPLYRPDEKKVFFLIGIFLFWSFCNLAPDYDAKWQMRGYWLSRLYLPAAAVYILYFSELFDSRRWMKFANIERIVLINVLFAILLFNVVISFGGPFWPSFSMRLHMNFYQHVSTEKHALINLDKFGFRPFGYCDQTENPGVTHDLKMR